MRPVIRIVTISKRDAKLMKSRILSCFRRRGALFVEPSPFWMRLKDSTSASIYLNQLKQVVFRGAFGLDRARALARCLSVNHVAMSKSATSTPLICNETAAQLPSREVLLSPKRIP